MTALDSVLEEKIKQIPPERMRELVTVLRDASTIIHKKGQRLVSFSCNDYLGLSHHPQVVHAAQEAIAMYGAGAGASRLVTGNCPLYETLESMLARIKHTEAALVFGSGYMANVGVISALVGREDMVIADRLVHASIIDGIALSGAKLFRFAHNETAQCRMILGEQRDSFRHCLIITETVFSMDGDIAPVEELKPLAEKHRAWLMTDDAHGLGIISGLSHAADIQVGTLSKAVGGYGGYVCGSRILIDYLVNHARNLIYTTALPPAVLAACIKALEIIETDADFTAQPLKKARMFTHELGLPTAQSAIVPLILGDSAKTLAASAQLEEAGFMVKAIRPPTVPEGKARLRFTFCAAHKDEDILRLVAAIRQLGLLEEVA